MSQDKSEHHLDQLNEEYRIYLENNTPDYLINQLVTLEGGVLIDDKLVEMILDRDPTGLLDDCYQEME